MDEKTKKLHSALFDFFEFDVVYLPKEDEELKESFLAYLESYYPAVFEKLSIEEKGKCWRIMIYQRK